MAEHKTSCPECKKVFKVTLEMQGKRVRCAKCKARFVVNIETPIDQVLTSAKPQEEIVEVQEQFEVPDPGSATLATPVSPPPSEPVEVVEVVTTQHTPPSPTPIVAASMASNLLDQAAKGPVPAKTGGAVENSESESPFDQLASKLMTAHAAASERGVYDPTKFMAYSTNANMVSRDSDIEKSTRLVIRGGALMLFAMMLIPLVLLGAHLSGSRWTCPLGGLFAAFVGSVGALLTLIGLRSKLGKAALFGGLPGGMFLLVGGLVVLLFMNDYWGSGIQLVPKMGSRVFRTRSSSPSWNSNRDPFLNDPTNPRNRVDPFQKLREQEERMRQQRQDPFKNLRPDLDPGFNNFPTPGQRQRQFPPRASGR